MKNLPTFVVRKNGVYIRHSDNLLEVLPSVPNFFIEPERAAGEGWTLTIEPDFETPEEREAWRKEMVKDAS